MVLFSLGSRLKLCSIFLKHSEHCDSSSFSPIVPRHYMVWVCLTRWLLRTHTLHNDDADLTSLTPIPTKEEETVSDRCCNSSESTNGAGDWKALLVITHAPTTDGTWSWGSQHTERMRNCCQKQGCRGRGRGQQFNGACGNALSIHCIYVWNGYTRKKTIFPKDSKNKLSSEQA